MCTSQLTRRAVMSTNLIKLIIPIISNKNSRETRRIDLLKLQLDEKVINFVTNERIIWGIIFVLIKKYCDVHVPPLRSLLLPSHPLTLSLSLTYTLSGLPLQLHLQDLLWSLPFWLCITVASPGFAIAAASSEFAATLTLSLFFQPKPKSILRNQVTHAKPN